MTMPIDLVLLRHGLSEGNAANERTKKGDHSDFTPKFLRRHSSKWRLVTAGRRQAEKAGIWIKHHLHPPFDRCYTSEYLRAMETAALLDLPLPPKGWLTDFNLRERDWGELDVMSAKERLQRFGDNYARRNIDRLYWKPINGESIADVCIRLYRVLDTLHRACPDGRALIVCHGDIMKGFRLLIERLTQDEFHAMSVSKDPNEQTHNCSILHYTRRDPDTNLLLPYYGWIRHICPWDLSRSNSTWRPIIRTTYSNKELLERVSIVPLWVDTI